MTAHCGICGHWAVQSLASPENRRVGAEFSPVSPREPKRLLSPVPTYVRLWVRDLELLLPTPNSSPPWGLDVSSFQVHLVKDCTWWPLLWSCWGPMVMHALGLKMFSGHGLSHHEVALCTAPHPQPSQVSGRTADPSPQELGPTLSQVLRLTEVGRVAQPPAGGMKCCPLARASWHVAMGLENTLSFQWMRSTHGAVSCTPPSPPDGSTQQEEAGTA